MYSLKQPRESGVKKLFYLAANGMAAFMDLAMGAAIAAVLATILGITPQWWHIAGGALLGVLPDFDLAWPILRRIITGKRVEGDHHESLFHLPFFMVPVVIIIFGALGGNYWSFLAFFCVSVHYLHDAWNMRPEDRIRWLFRIHPKLWALEGRKDPASYEHDYWIETFWLQPSSLALREIRIGSAGTAVATFILAEPLGGIYQLGYAIFALFLVWAGANLVWVLYNRLRPYI